MRKFAAEFSQGQSIVLHQMGDHLPVHNVDQREITLLKSTSDVFFFPEVSKVSMADVVFLVLQ